MSEANVEIAKRSIDALAAGGVEAGLAFVSRDVVWYPFPEWVEQSAFRGHDGFRRMAALFADLFDDFALRIEEFRDFGDRVVELGEMTGRIKGSAAPIRQPFAMVLSDFRDGKIGEGRNFSTWRQALEAVGTAFSPAPASTDRPVPSSRLPELPDASAAPPRASRGPGRRPEPI